MYSTGLVGLAAMAALKSSRISMQEEASPAFIAIEYLSSACGYKTAASWGPSSSRFAVLVCGNLSMTRCASTGAIATIINNNNGADLEQQKKKNDSPTVKYTR